MGKLLVDKKKLDKQLRKLQEANGNAEPTTNIKKTKEKIKTLQVAAKNVLKEGNEYKSNNPASCRYAYVQFQSMNGKKKFIEAMDVNGCKRCIMKCRKKDDVIAHKYLGGHWPSVTSAPDPSLILWANLGKGKIDRCGRSTLANIVAFILLLIGFVVVIALLNVRDDYKLNLSNCGDIEISKAEA